MNPLFAVQDVMGLLPSSAVVARDDEISWVITSWIVAPVTVKPFAVPGLFSGVVKPDHDKRKLEWFRTVHVRRVGQRRVRVESTFRVVLDPIHPVIAILFQP